MSLLQLDLPVDAVADKTVLRALFNAIVERTPTGAGKGQRKVKKGRAVTVDDEFVAHDILTNCRTYPKDAAPAAAASVGPSAAT